MRYSRLTVAAGAVALLLMAAAPASAQSWSPPSREMPAMQTLRQGGQGAGWLPSGASEARPHPEGANFVRFSVGPRPVAAFSDRNGDGRADMVEIFRGGRVAYQLIDADYDGTANVLRVYNESGALEREERL